MATIVNTQKALPVSLNSPVGATEGYRAVQITFDFTTQPAQNYSINSVDYGMSSIQSVFIDNSASNASFTLFVTGTAQKITCPPYTQGFFPVLLVGPTLNMYLSCAGVVNVPVTFLNQYIEMMIWSVNAPGSVVGTVTVSGQVNTLATLGTFTNRSGAMSAANTSQLMMPANGARKGVFIQNPYTAGAQGIASAEALYINFTAAAGVADGMSIELQPGQSFAFGAYVSTEAINVNAASANHRFIAREI